MPTGKITSIAAQANDGQRVNIFIDGAFAIGVSLTTLAREKLFVGLVLDDEAWQRLEAAESVEKATQAGLRLIEYRPRSAAEVRGRLARKGFAPEASEAAIERLAAAGLLDDDAFSRLVVESRRRASPRGARAIRAELLRKGVGRASVDAALADDEPEAEAARAMAVARGALRRYADAPDRHTFQRRLGGLLQRRGFGFDTIGPIIDRLWRELRDGAAPDDEDPDEA